ncbi:MAG TPA: hypothetical protein VGG48_00665 [Rhizomicrobium sp.]|jgi:hypothetical protein
MRILMWAAVAVVLATGALAAAAPDQKQFIDANTALRTALANGKLAPSLADPLSAPRVKAALDERVLTSVKVNDVGTFMAICNQVRITSKYYMFHGLGVADPSEMSLESLGPQHANAVAANLQRYQDEIELSLKFQVDCFSAALPGVIKFLKSIPPEQLNATRRSGIAQMKLGMVQFLEGAVVTQTDQLKESNKQIALDTVLGHLGILVPNTNLADRPAIAAVIDRTLQSPTISKASRAKLLTMRKAMDSKDCAALCRL